MNLDLVWCGAKDMQESLRFYCEALGGEVTFESSHWTQIKLGDLSLALHLADAPERGGFVVCMKVKEFESLERKIAECGLGRILGTHSTPSGELLEVADPSGNLLQFKRA